MRPSDQRATSTAPTMPMSGSIQVSPRYLAASSATMASNEVSASREDVQVGGPEIVVVVRVPAGGGVPATVFMRYVEECDAHTVDNESGDGDEDRVVVLDGGRVDEAVDAPRGHDHGERGEQHRPGEAAQGVHLAAAEAVARVVGVAARVDVGEGGDAQRDGVRPHVQAVGQQGHGGERQAREDLHDHHRRGDGDHQERAALARPPDLLAERVVMLPGRPVPVRIVRPVPVRSSGPVLVRLAHHCAHPSGPPSGRRAATPSRKPVQQRAAA